MSERPLILVCNDDGIDADGLWYLAEAVTDYAEVMVVAPAFNQSGMSAAFTLHRDLASERAHSRIDGVGRLAGQRHPGPTQWCSGCAATRHATSI